MNAFSRATTSELRTLAGELKAGRLTPTSGALALQRWFDKERADVIAAAIEQHALNGFSARQLGSMLDSIADDREGRPEALVDCVQLVVTGLGDTQGICRDTSAVVQSMFASATNSVDVVGFAVYQGREVFRRLSERMQELPNLEVRFFLNIARPHGDTSLDREILRLFEHQFKTKHWPENSRLPSVFYDPRALNTNPKHRASLHAKCVIVDGHCVFVSSANFTEAAHERNIEIGLRIDSACIAAQLTDLLNGMIATSTLIPLAVRDEPRP
jgi:hypothetical protein